MISPVTAHIEKRSECCLFLRRLWGLVLRHAFLYRGSWPRFVEMLYWPIISVLTYGFISLSVIRQFGGAPVNLQAFLAGVLLAELLSRATVGMLLLFMEELWSRNLGHLFASPVRLCDYAISILGLGAMRAFLAVAVAAVCAYFLFGFSLLQVGPPLVLYIGLLFMNSFWFGLLIVSLIMRYGLAAEWLGWMIAFSLLPFVAPYYPVTIMPHFIQMISWCLPATYVFESMKSLLKDGDLMGHELLIALGLNLLYLIAAAWVFRRSFHSARRRGGLLQVGE